MDLNYLLRGDEEFRYQMLARMQEDCKYYLGNGNRYRKYLWAGDEKDHIECMKALWESFSGDKKPEWLSYEDILDFEKQMVIEKGTVKPAVPDEKTIEYRVSYKPDHGEEKTISFGYTSRYYLNDGFDRDYIIGCFAEKVSHDLNSEGMKHTFSAIKSIDLTVTENDKCIVEDQLIGSELAQFLSENKEHFDIVAVYADVEKFLSTVDDVYSMDVESSSYKAAVDLVKDLCSRISPEIYDAMFDSSDLDLVFGELPYGDFCIYYYNPDSNAGGQIVECPFNAEQASRMLGNEDYIDVLAENTQYLSDIGTIHFFNTLSGLLHSKVDGKFLGTDRDAILKDIVQQQSKTPLTEQLQNASTRAATQGVPEKTNALGNYHETDKTIL